MSWNQIESYLAEAETEGYLQSNVVEQMFGEVAIRGGKDAEARLKTMMDNHDTGISALTKAVLLLAQSPFVTFGVGAETVPTEIPADDMTQVGVAGKPARMGPWDAGTVGLLRDLAERRLTGHNARDAILGEMRRLDADSASLLYRVLVKEMRIGCGPKTVNKFHKGLVPIFEHKGAQRTKEALHKVKWPCWAEYKLDGFRCVVKTDGKSFETFSRNGLPMPNLEYRAADLMLLTKSLINAGILTAGWWAWDGEGKKEGHFNETSSEARKAGRGEDLHFHIFDLIPWDHMAGGTEPIELRQARLDQVQHHIADTSLEYASYRPKLSTVTRFELDEEADAWELYHMARALGHEGLILKQKGTLYIPGKNSDWVKVKPEETIDLVCKGTYPGEKGSKNEGLIGGLTFLHHGVSVNVGSGLSDEDRARDPSYFINSVFEIVYHEVTPDGSLREPRVKCRRADKHPEDCDQ